MGKTEGIMTVLEKCWKRLDALMDELSDPDNEIYDTEEASLRAKGEATGVAWSIAQFYGRSVDWVRAEAVGRRNLRIQQSEAKAARYAGS